MRKKDAEPRIAPAKEQLIIAFPQLADLIEQTPVHLISKRNLTERRNKIADELGADEKTKVADTTAEAIVGERGYAVLLYYEHIRDNELEHTIYHEFGHILSIHANPKLHEEVRLDISMDYDTVLRSGSSVWSEFIAEAIAYIVEDGEPNGDIFAINWRLEHLMDEAVNSGYLEPYPLAIYLATMFENPTVDLYLQSHPGAGLGLNNCEDEVVPLLENILMVLSEQLKKDDYYRIERETLEQLGRAVDELWGYCLDRHNYRMLRAVFERVSNSDMPSE